MPRKQRSTWGCVQKMGRDKWRLRYQTPEGRRSKTVYGTRREADAEMAKLRVRLEEERALGPRPTFADCWENWYLPELERRLGDGSLRESTMRTYRNEWRHRLGPRWGASAMADVRPADFQEWLLTLGSVQANFSNILAGNMVKCAAFHGARGIEFKNVTYRLPRRGEKTSGKQVYTLDEIERVARAVKGTLLEVPTMLGGLASCRNGEACAPTLEDVSTVSVGKLTVAAVRIDKQLVFKGNALAPVKNPQSNRIVVLPEPWSLRLLEIAEEARASGHIYLNDDGCGEPVRRRLVNYEWRKAFEKNGALCEFPYLPMQKLRNSWETYMRWELGVDKDKIDKMMGHTSADVRSMFYDRPDDVLFAETVAEAFAKRKAPERTY